MDRHRLRLRLPAQFEKKREIVRENDDLPVRGFLDKPGCDTLPMNVIEGGHRIVEDDAGILLRGH